MISTTFRVAWRMRRWWVRRGGRLSRDKQALAGDSVEWTINLDLRSILVLLDFRLLLVLAIRLFFAFGLILLAAFVAHFAALSC
jgi:hypothetical protein